MKEKENLTKIFIEFFARKCPPNKYKKQREIAYHEFFKLQPNKRADPNSVLGIIERQLAGSLRVEIDATDAKIDGDDRILFFHFSYRFQDDWLVWGVLELSDTGVFISNLKSAKDDVRDDFSWLNIERLGFFENHLNQC
jgi:hypothetical protein